MVKTRQFGKRTYLGNPLNIINLFNKFEVDEILLLDIGASMQSVGPDFNTLEMLAEECWVPLAYGGGISQVKQIERLVRAGCEKVVLGSAVAHDLSLVRDAVREFGTQAVIGSIDARKRSFGGYETRVMNASRRLSSTPAQRARQLEEAGAGEILLQSIDRDGEMNGYDLKLIAEVTAVTSIPVIACGGAGERNELAAPIKRAGASASAAGSLFVFSGEERGVLINFPDREFIESLFLR